MTRAQVVLDDLGQPLLRWAVSTLRCMVPSRSDAREPRGLGVDLVVLRGKTDANGTGLRHCRARRACPMPSRAVAWFTTASASARMSVGAW